MSNKLKGSNNGRSCRLHLQRINSRLWRSSLQTQSGFTLLETVTVIAILGILSVVTFGFAAKSGEMYRLASDGEKVGSELWVTLEKITRELQHAAIVSEASGARLSFTDLSKSLCGNCVDRSTSILYRWENGTSPNRQLTLYREGNLSGAHIVADNITDFNVSIIPVSGLITIRITKTVGEQSVTHTTTIHPDFRVTENVF